MTASTDTPAQFSKVFQSLQRFVVSDLSNFYLDIAKDRWSLSFSFNCFTAIRRLNIRLLTLIHTQHRLYIRSSDDPSRRSCQTVLDALLKGLLAVLAPLAPHLAEDAWLSLPYSKPAESVFQAGWPAFDVKWQSFPKVRLR